MPRMMPLLLCASLPLSACTPAADAPTLDSARPAAGAPVAPSAPALSPRVDPDVGAPQASPPGASVSGEIRDGNRPPPALRICAHPVDGSAPTCIDSPDGAIDYRIEVAPGRYYLMGWVRAGELALIAHATQIRCIRAPCPADALIEVDVSPGEDRAGVDLGGGYVDVPAGWPARP